MAERMVFFATCAPGVEPVLHGEVRALRFGKVERQVGGVRFTGTWRDAWRANLWLRSAVRVLWRLDRFAAADADALYRGVGRVDWRRFVRPDGSLVVDAQSRESALDHSQFVAQRVKDAIADQLRARCGRRPSVDKDDPDLRVHLHLYRDRATLSVDTSGESLHKRGWRRYQGRAPLAENLAAAVLALAGWDRRAPLLDPLCGSGTLLVEAGLWACNAAPGTFRTEFGFERWPGHDAAGFRREREAAWAARRPAGKLIVRGSDRESEHVEGARENIAATGLQDVVTVEVADVAAFAPRRGWNAWVVTNPPWGERIGDAERVVPVYRALGDALRRHGSGYSTAVLSSNRELLDALALEQPDRHELVAGGLPCWLQRGRLP